MNLSEEQVDSVIIEALYRCPLTVKNGEINARDTLRLIVTLAIERYDRYREYHELPEVK